MVVSHIPSMTRPTTDTARLHHMSARRVRALAAQVRHERMRIQQQALLRGVSVALGERLAGVEELERACQIELARRGRWRSLRRWLTAPFNR